MIFRGGGEGSDQGYRLRPSHRLQLPAVAEPERDLAGVGFPCTDHRYTGNLPAGRHADPGAHRALLLDLGAQAFAAELDKLGVEHTLELFDGKHGGLTYRYPGAIRGLVLALR